MKLAIITSHPIQYNAPLFAFLAKEKNMDLKVFYTWGEDVLESKFDPDFGKIINWDIPLLEGYSYQFTINISKEPGSHHYFGIINPNLISEILEWKPDAIWVWGWAFDSHLKVMRHFSGKIPVWFRGDSTLLDEKKGFSVRKILRRIFLKWVYSHIDKAFYVGTHNKEYFRKHGLSENQLIYAPHAIDNERFFDFNGEKKKLAAIWKDSLGIKTEEFVLLFAGKLEPRKNPLFLIDLMKNIDSNWHLLIVGNGPLEKDLKMKFKLNRRVHFIDFQNQSHMPIVYRLADYLILPSISETWGLAINEALASGTKVIASVNCGGAIDLINKNNGHIIYNLRNSLEFFKTIEVVNSNLNKESMLLGHSYQDILDALNGCSIDNKFS